MNPTRTIPRLALAALSVLTLACTGEIGAGKTSGGSSPTQGDKGNGNTGATGGGGTMMPPPPMPRPDGTIDSAGPYALRRLTVLEYSNTLRDLLGVTLSESDRRGFAADQVLGGGYASGAALVNSTDSRQFLDISDKVATAATADLSKLMPAGCAAPAANGEGACIGKFLDQFGLRAFRRPMSTDETARFTGLFTRLRGATVMAPYGEAVHDLLVALLQSPEFLYRWELNGAPIMDGGLIKFGPYEIASRLSYLIWSSMPDDALFTAAKTGGLDKPEQIAAQADRMLKDDKARDALTDFHMQWLGIYGADELEKGEVYTTYTPEVGKAMLGETAAFVDAVLGPQGSGKLEELFTSSSSYLNEALAKHYGVSGVTGANFRKVDMNPTQRAGILTQGAFLTKHSKEVESFPIARGVYFLRNVLCIDLPEPQIMLPPPPEQKMGVTTRQLYEDFTKATACQACHAQINGAGFAFENYDAVGGWRSDEEGQKVDASGTLNLPSGMISFKNAVELMKTVSKSAELRECVAKNWMRALLRREERPDEAGSLKDIGTAFAGSSYDVRSLIVALTKTKAFTHRNPIGK